MMSRTSIAKVVRRRLAVAIVLMAIVLMAIGRMAETVVDAVGGPAVVDGIAAAAGEVEGQVAADGIAADAAVRAGEDTSGLLGI